MIKIDDFEYLTVVVQLEGYYLTVDFITVKIVRYRAVGAGVVLQGTTVHDKKKWY